MFLAATILTLGFGLRPDAFFAGDPGVKLIAARNALARPSRPFEIPLPTVNGSPVPFVEPFFARHGDHSHAVTSELFPILTAPVIALLGLRGAYVLPALGLLIAVVAVSRIGTALDPNRRPIWSAVVAVLATPFLFYGLEFWEHMPAIALGASATGLLVRAARAGAVESSGFRPARDPAALDGTSGAKALHPQIFFAAGGLFGLAVLLRPEAAWFVVAVLAASRQLHPPPPWRSLLIVVVGAVLVAAPLELYAILHFGTLAPPHLATNAGLLNGVSAGSRAAFAKLWFLSAADASILHATPAILLAFAAPLAITKRGGAAFLWTIAALDVGLVLLTAPNEGGAQWAPRYLLFAYVPLAILAADATDWIRPRDSRRRDATASSAPGRLTITMALAALVLIAGTWSVRASYRTLRGTKVQYGRLVDALTKAVPADGYVVTDVWWLDQAAAAIAPRARFLYADNDREAAELMTALQAGSASRVVRVTNRTSPRAASWGDARCRSQSGTEPLPVGELVLTSFDCSSTVRP